MLRRVMITALFVVPACGSTAIEEPIPTSPPAALDGVVGMTGSYCWQGACVDKTLPQVDVLPEVSDPSDLHLLERTKEVVVELISESETVRIGLSDFLDGNLPHGNWNAVRVLVAYDPFGDATYYWRLAQ